ncbi:MAG: serine/threonine protein kinase, partial [Microcystis sp.]
PEGFTPRLIGIGFCFFIFLVLTGVVVFISPWMGWFFRLFFLPFWFVGLGMLYQIIYCLKGEEIITIDRQEIVAIQRIWGLTLSGKKKMAREHINKLVISDGNRVYVPMALTIWAGTKEYTISSKTKEYLSNPEIEWLAAELSQWLGIPITNN